MTTRCQAVSVEVLVPISFQCPNCGTKVKAPESAVGKSLACPRCETQVTCPEPVYDAEPADIGDEDNPYGMADARPERVPPTESRRPCPMCGEMIPATAAKCRFCGEVFDLTLLKAMGRQGNKGELRTIAKLQKYMLISILSYLSAFICAFAAGFAMQPTPPGSPPTAATVVIGGVLALVWLVASLGSLVLSGLLATRMYGAGGAVVVIVLQFVPCANLITLFVLNSNATTLLRDAGCKVGFFGADLSVF